MPRSRRQQLEYYDRYPASRQRSRYREPIRYRRRDESCLERFLHGVLIVGIIGLVVLLLGFAATHFQQTLQVIAAIFAAISFLISIFPLLIRIAGVLLGIFVVLFVGYWVVRIWTAISRSLSLASAERAQAAALKAKARQEKIRSQQSSVQVQREQVRLAKESFDQDQHRRNAYRQPQLDAQPHRTRMLTRPIEEVPQAPQAPQSQTASSMVPSISQLLRTGAIRAGQTDILHGFEFIQGVLEALRGELPMMAIIGGRGRSGKSRRLMLMIFQAILLFYAQGGGKVTICDPHWIKPDGLSNMLAPFANWVRFARTDDEIVAAAQEHIEEMESRLTPSGSIHGEGLQPRLLVIDEFGKLMKSDKISKKHKQILTKAVRETAAQWAGVGGRAWIAGQEWTQDAIGDTAIRKDAQAIYCHPLSDEFASVLFARDARAQRMVQQISRRECVYKDSDNNVKRIITATLLDEEIDVMVAYLQRSVPLRRTRQMPQQPAVQRPPTQSMQRAQRVANPADTFHLARTVDLAPKALAPQTPQKQTAPPAQQPAASATWDYDDTQRQQYGRGSRSLHPTRLTAPVPPPMVPQTTTDDLSTWKIATGEPDDTVLIPEERLPAPARQFMSRSTTGRMQAAPPATEDLTQPVLPDDAVSRLAQLRRRPTKI